MPSLYVAGPMTGLPEFNYPAFFTAAERLERYGYETRNPARRQQAPGKTWADFMREDLADVLAVDGIALLPGWESSRGARLEVQVAEALGVQIASVQDWVTRSVR